MERGTVEMWKMGHINMGSNISYTINQLNKNLDLEIVNLEGSLYL
jgi:hypothetical protein